MTRARRPARFLVLAACHLFASSLLLTEALLAEALVPLPELELARLEENLRTRFEALHAAVESLARDQEENRRELAEAYGALGQLYLVYEMYAGAEACFRNARHLDPAAPPWSYYLARSLEADGRYEPAIAEYARARALDPDDLATRIRPGNLLLAMNRPGDAEELFRRALDIDPGCAAAFVGLGKAALLREAPGAAITHFERALELQPAASGIHYVLAQAYRKTGERERAREHLSRHAPVEVKFPDPLGEELRTLSTVADFEIVVALAGGASLPPARLLTYTLSLLGQVEGAAEQIEQTLRALTPEASGERENSTRARLHYLAGGLFAYRGAPARAIRHFRAALEADPDLADARIKLANAEARRGRYDEALRLYSAALEKNPDLDDARLKRAAALMALGRTSEAILDLRRLRAAEAPNPEAVFRLAVALESNGRIDEAAATYRSAAELLVSNQEQAGALHRAARLRLGRGAFDDARELCEQALRIAPEHTEARLTLASLLGHLGRLEESAAQYREALRHDADSESAHLGESAVLLVLERWEEARQRLGEALRILPHSDRVAHLLARLLASAPADSVRDGERALELVQALSSSADLGHRIQRADTLAMAYAELGRFDAAVQALEEPIAAARRGGAGDLAEYLLVKQRHYAAGRPWTARTPNEIVGGLGPGSLQ